MSSKEKFDYKHRSSKEDSHKSKYNKDKDRRRKRSKSSSPKRKKHSPSSHSSSSSSTIRQTSKHKREVSRERLQKERRKRKYDSEVDNLKDKELLKRKEYELKKQKEETKRKEEQNKIKEMEKPKEKEMTEEERQQFLRRKRIAMANLVVMLGKEDQKKKEENLAKGELEEDFLAKMEESNDMFNEKKIESPTLEVIKEEETVKELPTKEELKTEISFNNNKIKLPRLPKEFAQARKEQQPKQQPIEQQEKFPNEDPLDAYMKTIEKEATVQDYQVIQILTNQTLQKRYDEITFKDKMEDDDQDTVKIIDESVNPVDSQFDQSKVITLEDILTLKETTMADDNLEDIAVDDEYHHALIQSIKDREVEANVEDKRKAMVIYQEDVNEYLKDEEFEYVEEQWLKLKRAGEKVKELKLVNHAEIKYEDFRKNLYIEPKEISNLTQEQVEQIRHEKGNIKVRGKNTPRPILNWYHCGLNSTILAVLNKLKFDEPFPIQAQAIPCIMSGRDVIGIAETGSGKTMAYVLPMLRHVLDQRPLKEGEGPIGLIMVPTRELAVQIYSEIRQFTKHLGLRVTCAYGGSGIGPQISELRRGSEIVVCTPGRLIDILCLSNGKITNLRRVK